MVATVYISCYPYCSFPLPVPFPPFRSAVAIACPTWILLVLTLTQITDIFWNAYQPFIWNSMFVCYFRISVPAWYYQVSICGLKCSCSSFSISILVTTTFESFIVLLLLNVLQAVVIIQNALRPGQGHRPVYNYYHFLSPVFLTIMVPSHLYNFTIHFTFGMT